MNREFRPVCPHPDPPRINARIFKQSGLRHGPIFCGAQEVVSTLRRVEELVPPEKELGSQPNCIVETGDPAEKILDMAGWYKANIIVLGIRPHSVGAATHLFRPTAHRVIAGATCPVLTVRG
jgi:nucleotide-binding universal stress UspA family protein